MVDITKIFAFIMSGAAVIGLLFGVFTFIQNSNANSTNLKSVNNELKTINGNITKINSKIYGIDSNIVILKVETKEHSRQIEAFRRNFTNYLINDSTLTKQEFYKYMQDLKDGNQASHTGFYEFFP